MGEDPGKMRTVEERRQPSTAESPVAAANYIGSLADELAQIARRNGLDSLGFILDMARLEADQITKDSTPESRCA